MGGGSADSSDDEWQVLDDGHESAVKSTTARARPQTQTASSASPSKETVEQPPVHSAKNATERSSRSAVRPTIGPEDVHFSAAATPPVSAIAPVIAEAKTEDKPETVYPGIPLSAPVPQTEAIQRPADRGVEDRQRSKVAKVVELTQVSEDEAKKLLETRNWNVEETVAAYFAGEEKRKAEQADNSEESSQRKNGAERETMRERFRGAREKADAFAGKVETFVATAVEELGMKDAVVTFNDELSNAFKEIGRGFSSLFSGGEEERQRTRERVDPESRLHRLNEQLHKMFPELPKDETLLELYESRIIQTYCVKGNALTPDRLFAFPTSIYISEGYIGLVVRIDARARSRTLHPLEALSSVDTYRLPNGVEQLSVKVATGEEYCFRFDDVGSLRGCHGILFGIVSSRK